MSSAQPVRPSADVILLNGTPSCGKTTVATALQTLLGTRFLRTSVDDFLAMYQDRSRLADLVPAGNGGTRIALNDEGRRVMRAFHGAVVAMAQTGWGVIVDDLFLERAIVADWSRALSLIGSASVLVVGVRCPLDECERREGARGDRTAGLARGHFELAHRDAVYDIEVDTGRESALDCARRIAEYRAAGPPPSALAELHRRFGD